MRVTCAAQRFLVLSTLLRHHRNRMGRHIQEQAVRPFDPEVLAGLLVVKGIFVSLATIP